MVNFGQGRAGAVSVAGCSTQGGLSMVHGQPLLPGGGGGSSWSVGHCIEAPFRLDAHMVDHSLIECM